MRYYIDSFRSVGCKMLDGSFASLVKCTKTDDSIRWDRSDLMVSRIKGALIPLARRIRWTGMILFKQRYLDICDSSEDLTTTAALPSYNCKK